LSTQDDFILFKNCLFHGGGTFNIPDKIHDKFMTRFLPKNLNKSTVPAQKLTEGSKSNILCCALLAQQVHATFASDSRMWRASSVNATSFTSKICVRCASCSSSFVQMSGAPAAREARNKGCSLWSLCK
jgi:hypothetical protein